MLCLGILHFYSSMVGVQHIRIQGGGKFRPGTISQGIISPGDNFATLEIPKAPSKHVSRKMSLNFRKIFCLSVSICPWRT